jgi:hypothetical protein
MSEDNSMTKEKRKFEAETVTLSGMQLKIKRTQTTAVTSPKAKNNYLFMITEEMIHKLIEKIKSL